MPDKTEIKRPFHAAHSEDDGLAPLVLIVEDSATQRMRLQLVLERAGMRVEATDCTDAALAWIQTGQPDLVISDVLMPGLTGFQLCDLLKHETPSFTAPVMLLTTLSDPADILRALKCGADGFVAKPYRPELLTESVERILSNFSRRKTSSLHAGIWINFAGKEQFLDNDRLQILGLLLSSFEHAVERNTQLRQQNDALATSLSRIRELETSHRAILEGSGDATVVVDATGRIRYANTSACIQFDLQLDDDLDTRLPFDVNHAAASEQRLEVEGGDNVILDVRSSPIRWQRLPAHLVVMRDVTELTMLRLDMKTT